MIPGTSSRRRVKSLAPSRNRRPIQWSDTAAVAFIIVCCFLFLAPLVFERKVPVAADTIAWRGAAEAMMGYRTATGEVALWAPGIFSGMPGYLIYGRYAAPSLDTVLNLLGRVFSWQATYLLFGALCLYALLRRWGARPSVAAFGALVFVLTPYLRSLIEAGHNTKLKAIAFLPAVLLGADLVFERRNLLSALLLALALSLELRANHAQIAYYGIILLLVYGLALVVSRVRAGEGRAALAAVGLSAGAVVLAALLVAQPYANIREYAHYSIRGGGEGAGLSKEYATNWSLPPEEMVTFLVPGWFGLRDATYWGEMPFTSSSNYLGILPLVLAAAVFFLRRDARVTALAIVTAIAAFLSFGKYLGGFNDFLLDHLPYYNKFRVPSMILVLTEVTVAILAALGLEALLRRFERAPARDRAASVFRAALIASAVLLVVILAGREAMRGYFVDYGLSRPEDASRYQSSVLPMLKDERWRILSAGLVQFALLATASFAALWIAARRKIPAWGAAALVVGLLLVDLALVDRKFLVNLEPPRRGEQQFPKTAADDFLMRDESVHRIFPMGQLFGDNRWAFRHESIGGYHAAKMRTYQRLLEATVYKSQDPNAPALRNALRMLNVKYLVVPGLLPGGPPEVFRDTAAQLVVYELPGALPRAWLVESVETAPSEDAVLARITNAAFDPARQAVLIGQTPAGLGSGPVSGGARIVRRDLHTLELQVESSRPALLVVSEIDYPPDWRAWIDGTPAEIRPANLVLRSVVVPAGRHEVALRLTGPTYHRSVTVTWAGTLVALAGFGLVAFRARRRPLTPRSAPCAP